MSEQLDDLLISADASIRDAMLAIDRGACEIALAVDGDRRLLGTVSDGDVRRALLSGATVDDPVKAYVTQAPYVASPTLGRAEVLDLMRARRISQVPIVDSSGRIFGLHTIRELLGAQERPNWAVIMAGGRGTRLAPLTERLPKPMVQVAGRPLLERLVLHLVGYGIQTILLSVNHLAEVIEQHFGDGGALGCRIGYLREQADRPLGTGGALGLIADLADQPDAPLLVLNGDLVTQFSVAALLDSHKASGAIATVAVKEYHHEIPFGVVECSEGERLIRVAEKPIATWLVNAGIYVIEPSLIERIPRAISFPLTSLIQDCADRREAVGVWKVDADWQDIGRPSDLHTARGSQ